MDDRKSSVLEMTPKEKAAAKKMAKLAAKQAAKLRKAIEAVEAAKTGVVEKFQREQNYVATSYERAAAEWDQMMADVAHNQCRIELEQLRNDVVQTLDNKTHQIERLTEDVAKCKDQFDRMSKSNLDFIDHSKDILKQLAKTMRDQYDSEVEQYLSSFYRDKNAKTNLLARRKCFFENVMHATNVMFDQRLDNAKNDHVAQFEDMSDAHVEHNDWRRAETCRNIENLYKQMRKTVSSYLKSSMTVDRVKQYDRMVERENRDAATLERNDGKMVDMQRVLLELTLEREAAMAARLHGLNAIRKEKDYFTECFLMLRSRFDADIRTDERKMHALMGATYTNIKKLTENEHQGGLILGVTAAIRKMQTEQEKITPWPYYDPAVDATIEQSQQAKLISQRKLSWRRSDDPQSEKVGHLPRMEQFWLRVSHTNTQNLCLEEEKTKLEQENAELRDMIGRYCKQDAYNRAIASLRLNQLPSVVLPIQEASHMSQLRKRNAGCCLSNI